MKTLRRAFGAIVAAAATASVLKLRGFVGVPSRSGGWRVLSGRHLR